MRNKNASAARDVATLAVFLAAACVIGVAERMIPFDSFVPGVKLGLSNVVILTAIYLFKFSKALTLVVLKCVMIALLSGSASSFAYSVSGSVLSFLVMWALIQALKRNPDKVSPVGVSAIGAVCHNIGQILAAAFILGSINVIVYLPALIISGVITGVLVGFTVKFVMPAVRNHNLI